MDSLNIDEISFLTDLVGNYLETELDLNQREWDFARGLLDTLNAELEVKYDV